ncbi:hypothetical protein [Cellulomonas xiejunii]|uniref:Secreted protein n=1 Tax=Cellulomonas xiejunii TaxID=2968083 RepID=A0ABY5KP13_9CELL|nr:hypothetical protein [Cellulomonas xiejunii]MCC2313763.1 hypothetical protein [Cellulomonas xiejunii]MCC2323446.1 hypothetical protein [Cellulomonas xiejunii]UUI71623.1 hypothetical protein NP048_17820 [Cellulomonas xiejunii]
MEWWIVAVAAGVVGAAAAWASHKGWIYLGTKRPPGGGSAALGPLIEVFQPSYSHYQEEKERHHVVVDQNAPPAPDEVDLPRVVAAQDDEGPRER